MHLDIIAFLQYRVVDIVASLSELRFKSMVPSAKVGVLGGQHVDVAKKLCAHLLIGLKALIVHWHILS